MIKLTVIRNECRLEYDSFGNKKLKTEVATAADGLIQVLAKELDMSYNVAALVLMQACTVIHQKTKEGESNEK